MTLQLTLTGAAAEQILRDIARTYAIRSIQSTLDGRHMANCPWWGGVGTGKPDFKSWSRRVEIERRDYRDTLLSLLPELPPVTIPEWKLYEHTEGSGEQWDGKGKFDPRRNWRGTGKFYPSYNATTVREIANNYAATIWQQVAAR